MTKLSELLFAIGESGARCVIWVTYTPPSGRSNISYFTSHIIIYVHICIWEHNPIKADIGNNSYKNLYKGTGFGQINIIIILIYFFIYLFLHMHQVFSMI